MPNLKNNFSMSAVFALIVTVGGIYWFSVQKSQIEPFAKQIDSIKVNQNSPIGMKDYVLMKRDLITSQNTLNNAVFQFFSTSFLVFTAYTAWRNLIVSEKKQTVESFAKAVEQLGSDELHTRVGGIFVLEQIAQGSPEYHWTVIEVLTSYIRDLSIKEESTSKPSKTKENFSDLNNKEKEKSLLGKDIHKRLQEIREEPAISVRTDIQAALTVICRRNIEHDSPEKKVIDLRFCDIRGANIKNGNLRYANLTGAKISRAQLENVDLSSARLRSADLTEANLKGANLNESDFSDAILTEADFENCSLKKAIFSGSDLRGVNFKNANLEEAIFDNPIE